MAVIAELAIEADQFLLGQIIAEHPGISVELERVVPADQRVMPYIWSYGSDLEAFEDAMEDSPNVQSVSVLDRFEDRALYRIEWEDPAEQLIAGMADLDATILEAHSDDEWTFRIRFADHRGLARFNRYCVDNGISFRLVRVSAMARQPPGEWDLELTRAQHEALQLALERGYFRVPREADYAELAEELDVSVQALSERIRRGVHAVLESVLEPATLGND